MDNNNELLPIIDNDGNVAGKVPRQQAHNGSKVLHPVVHLHLFNDKGDLYLQKRPLWKDILPGKWDTATGGHVNFGEDIRQALIREVEEELGLTDYIPEFVGKYIYESDVEKEFIFVYKTVYNGKINPNHNELADGRFWTSREIAENLGNETFTPNFESEYQRFLLCRQ